MAAYMKPENSGTPKELGVAEVRIAPGLDAARHLEDFEREADRVEQAHGLQLVPGFQLHAHHPQLDRHRHHQQQVVARDAEQARARHQEDGGEEQAHEQAGARFLDAEPEEFDQAAAQAGQPPRAVVHQEVVDC
jgi:hypothetical protein